MQSMVLPDPTTQNHWATNPVNPFDVNYDPDSDGWYGRTFSILLYQGTWENRQFTLLLGDVSVVPNRDLPFTNYMEYLNGTRPDTNDSDGDAVTFNTIVNAGMVLHDRD